MSNDRNWDGESYHSMCSFYTKCWCSRLRYLLVEHSLCRVLHFCYYPPSITVMAAKSICPGYNASFTLPGLSQHIAKTNHECCHAVLAASQPQSLRRSPPSEPALPTFTQNSMLWGHPDRSFGSEHPSGHSGISSDLPSFQLLGNGSITTGNVVNSKFAPHRSGPYTNPQQTWVLMVLATMPSTKPITLQMMMACPTWPI